MGLLTFGSTQHKHNTLYFGYTSKYVTIGCEIEENDESRYFFADGSLLPCGLRGQAIY